MIYEIVCNETGERYIGSTVVKTLATRLAQHKSDVKKQKTNPCMSKHIIGRGNYYINLLEKVDVENRDELRMKEREWYEKLPNINKARPYVSREDALKEKREYMKAYNEKNKEYIYARNNENRRKKYAEDKLKNLGIA
jgi:hypothetical protein